MQTFTASFLGTDRPGVVAGISSILGDCGCNIIALAQTIVSGEFAAIFIVHAPDDATADALYEKLTRGLADNEIDLSVIVRPKLESAWASGENAQPFVISVDGPDRSGLIASMSRIFARHSVNIESLNAVLGEGGDGHALFVFEVMVPPSVDLGRLRRELELEGQQQNMRTTVQHRDIFEAIHRVNPI